MDKKATRARTRNSTRNLVSCKRSVSEMVAYVLLVLIAISTSIIVYQILKIYTIKPEVKCEDETSISIEDYSCYSPRLMNLTLRNTGLHNIDGIRVLISNETGKTPAKVLKEANRNTGEEIYFPSQLNTSEAKTLKFTYLAYNNINKIIIKPFISGKENLVICNNAIITQDISGCN